MAVVPGTVDFSNVGFHPCGNVDQHVIRLLNPFSTGNAVAVVYATTVATVYYARGTGYYALQQLSPRKLHPLFFT